MPLRWCKNRTHDLCFAGATLWKFPKNAPAAGTEMVVWLNTYFYARTAEDQRRKLEYEDALDDSITEKIAQTMNDTRARAEELNASLKIPVPWRPGIKAVLSGLSEYSIGNGRSRRTLQHVLLDADLTYGRLVRKSGDFLCSSSPAENGQRWSDPAEQWHDGNGARYPAPVTCTRCLVLAKRFRE